MTIHRRILAAGCLLIAFFVCLLASHAPTSASSSWDQLAKFVIGHMPDDSGERAFGRSVAISGNVIVVGSFGDNVTEGNSGSAYVFVLPESGWTDTIQTAKLTASDGADGDQFGCSVAIDGDTIVVGAFGDDHDETTTGAGSAYLFVKPAGGWVDSIETAKLTASDTKHADEFARSVAVSGDTVAIGSWGDDVLAKNTGSIYVYEKPASGWVTTTENAKLTASNGELGDGLGYQVDIDGDTIVSGAYTDDGGTNTGSVYVFVKPEYGWEDGTETAILTAREPVPYSNFGSAGAIVEDGTIAVLSVAKDVSYVGGSVYIFEKPEIGWMDGHEAARLFVHTANGYAGPFHDVSINDSILVLGAPVVYNDYIYDASASGTVYVFEKPESGWQQASNPSILYPDARVPSDYFGSSIDIEGRVVVAGAPTSTGGSGASYIFGLQNSPPTLTVDGPYFSEEGLEFSLFAQANDPDGDSISYLWESSPTGCHFSDPASAVPTLTCYDDGNYLVKLTASDGVNPAVSRETSVDIANVAPTIAPSGEDSADEGSPYELRLGSVIDPGNDTVTEYIVHWGDGQTETFSAAGDVTHTYQDGLSSPVITVDLVDEDGTHLAAGTRAVIVNNAAPDVGPISAMVEPVEAGTEISASADFTDAGVLDTHTAVWDWGDGSTSTGSIMEMGGVGSVAGEHTYPVPGIYAVTLTVTDKDGASDIGIFQFAVVYDPSGGFVTGGGWINSPAGAYVADSELTGKANFGFVSKYRKGVNVPSGDTRFQFKAGDLNFYSDVYDWLVVAGAKAMFKGTGTINGAGNYGFMLSAIDADQTASTETDLFRIKIWDKSNGDAIVYDNQLGASDDADPTTAVGGGNIIVHKSK